MAQRVLALVLMVLLLALPHPGSRVSTDEGTVATAEFGHAGHASGHAVGHKDGSQAAKHFGLTCIAVCTGSPLVEGPMADQPIKTAVALWVGAGIPLSRALAHPATPSRPPNVSVTA